GSIVIFSTIDGAEGNRRRARFPTRIGMDFLYCSIFISNQELCPEHGEAFGTYHLAIAFSVDVHKARTHDGTDHIFALPELCAYIIRIIEASPLIISPPRS